MENFNSKQTGEEKLTLRDRLIKCKQQLGISYISICKKLNIPSVSTMYNFTGGIRDLPQKYKQGLDQFLTRLGF